MIWTLADPSRAQQERDALDALAANSNWLIPGEWRIDASLRVIWDAEIVIADRNFPISLRYPNHFPHSPPLVIPRDTSERWSSHQYGPGGELCLEYRPDNWHPSITGAQMVESAYHLLSGERPAPGETGRVPSAHSVTLGQILRGDIVRFLITRATAAEIAEIPAGQMREGTFTIIFRDKSWVTVLSNLKMSADDSWKDDSIPGTVVNEGAERDVAIVALSDDVAFPSLKTRTDLLAFLKEAGLDLPEYQYAVLVSSGAYRAYLLDKDDDSIYRISVIPPQPESARLDPDHEKLRERTVAIVGCGSMGSKIAVMLARVGVNDFLLIDDDIMLPENVIRHDLDWREMGFHKVDGVARRIKLVNPCATCSARQQPLGGQQSSGSIETLIETLSKRDLIVDATADARVFNYLCAAVAVGKPALVWAELFGGGFGGLIARHRPGLEPEPASMRANIEYWCQVQGKPFPHAAEDYETRSAGTPMIADDADVTVIAAHATRLAIDTLIQRDPSMFPHSVYMIGLSEGWVFEQPFDTRPIEMGPPPNVAQAPPDPQLVKAEGARFVEMLTKLANETATDENDTGSPAQ